MTLTIAPPPIVPPTSVALTDCDPAVFSVTVKVCDAGVGGGEGVVGRQPGLHVRAGEVDRAGVPGRDAAQRVDRRHGDVERVAGVRGRRGGEGQVRDLPRDGDGRRRGRHVRGRHRDRLVAAGDEPDRPGEGVRAGVGRGERVGDAGVERVEGVPRGRGRGRVAAADEDGAAEPGGDVPVGIDGGDGHRQDRAGGRRGRGGDLEGDGAGQVLGVRVVVRHHRDAAAAFG